VPFPKVNESYVDDILYHPAALEVIGKRGAAEAAEVIREGYKLDIPKLLEEQITPQKQYHTTVSEATSLELENQRRKGIIVVEDPKNLKCIAPLKVVPKSNGEVRVCWNCSSLNDLIPNKPVHLDDPFDATVWNKKFWCKVDLKSAFF
jgi:hypothetical protein